MSPFFCSCLPILLFYIYFDLNNQSLLKHLCLTLRPHSSSLCLQYHIVFLLIKLPCRRLRQVFHHILLLFLRLLVSRAPSLLHNVVVPSYFAFPLDTLIQVVLLLALCRSRRPLRSWWHYLQPLTNFLLSLVFRSLRRLLFLWTSSLWPLNFSRLLFLSLLLVL